MNKTGQFMIKSISGAHVNNDLKIVDQSTKLSTRISQIVSRILSNISSFFRATYNHAHFLGKKISFFFHAGSVSDYIFTMPRRHETINAFTAHLSHEQKIQLLDKALTIATVANNVNRSSKAIYAADFLKIARDETNTHNLCNRLLSANNLLGLPAHFIPEILSILAAQPSNERLAILNLLLVTHTSVFSSKALRDLILSDLKTKSRDHMQFILAQLDAMNILAQPQFFHTMGEDRLIYQEIMTLPEQSKVQIMRIVLQNIDQFTPPRAKLQLLRQIRALHPEDRQHIDVRDAVRHVGARQGQPQTADHKISVHAGKRDDYTRDAIIALYAKQGDLSQSQIDTAYTELIEFLVSDKKTSEKTIAALCDPGRFRGAYGALVGDGPLTVRGHEIHGKEFAARLWLFTKSIEDEKDKELAKYGIISGLLASHDEDSGTLWCNPGKVQRLVVSVLQGRLEGINVEGHELGVVDDKTALALFFQCKKHNEFKKLEDLIAAAQTFIEENPSIMKEAFMQGIYGYAEVMELQ